MPEAMRLHVIDLVVLGAYLVAVVMVGSWFVRRERSTRDYFRGSGRVPWWAAGLSLYGTGLSAITFIAIPAMVYRTNWAYFMGMVGGVAAVPLVRHFFLPFYRDLDITTAYEYLQLRFALPVRLIGSLTFIIYHIGRTAIVLVLPALVLGEAIGLNIYISIAVIGAFAIIYTMLGGIEAVVWTDVMQVVVLIGGAATATTISILSLDGGFSEFLSVAQSENKLALYNPGISATEATMWVIFLGYGASQFNLYVSDQSLVQRYLTTRDTKSAGRALWFSVLGGLPVQVLFYTVGTAMFVFYQAHPDLLPDVATKDAIVPVFLIQQLPIGLTGVVLAGVFAAGMSTIDSSMNSIATAIVTDFYQPFVKDTDERKRMRLARTVTLIVGVVGTAGAIYVAAMNFADLLTPFLRWLFLIMGILAGLFTLGIVTVRANWIGALIGAVVAVAAVAICKGYTPLNWFLYSLIGLGTCVTAGYLASLLWPITQHDLTGLTLHTRRPKAPDTP